MDKPTIISKAILLTILLVSSESFAHSTVSEVQILSKNNEIRVGKPYIVRLTVNLASPNVKPDTKKVLPNWIQGGFFKITCLTDEPNSFVKLKAFPLSLSIMDQKGTKYGASFTLFYGHGAKKLLFDEPGKYSVQFVLSRSELSNTLDLAVNESTRNGIKALALLSDPDDYLLLEFGGLDFDRDEKLESISHLQQVTAQFSNTLLAKWCAARLGIEYFKDFQKKHPSIKKFKAGLENDGIKEPLYQKACEYLTTGAQLPDEFPIREEVLWNLCSIEHIRGNFDKAISLLDELSVSAESSQARKKALRHKAELLKLKKQASEKQGDTKNQ